MKMNGAEILIRMLEMRGVTMIAGIPGGANLPLYNALYASPIRHILARHEQGAGFIAHGMARSTGRAAVCFATSGPGATNLITAIADAKLDSVPLVAITGQVPRSMIGTDAFQEVNTCGMTMNLTKHNYLVMDARDLLRVIPEAFAIAESGRPGPVVIDIPKDVQTEEVEFDAWPEFAAAHDNAPVDGRVIQLMASAINAAKRPVIYAGGGIICANASALLAEMARKNSIPVALTLMGLGAFPPDDPLYLGMLGMHGSSFTNHLLDDADLIIALGARFDDRAVGKVAEFCPAASILHVDIDDSEIDKIRKSNISLAADVGAVLEALVPLLEHNDRPDWMAGMGRLKSELAAAQEGAGDPRNPKEILRRMSKIAADDAIICTDVGQHQMWVAQHYPFRHPRTLLTSGGLGTMGFGFPAAIGAALANPGRQVICVSGDGSFQMNIQELATLAELKLNVIVLIMNNQHLGLVRQQQELFFGGNYIASRFENRVDFAAIARGYGIRSVNLGAEKNPAVAVMELLKFGGPCVIDAPIHYEENVFPMVPPGAANREMIGAAVPVSRAV